MKAMRREGYEARLLRKIAICCLSLLATFSVSLAQSKEYVFASIPFGISAQEYSDRLIAKGYKFSSRGQGQDDFIGVIQDETAIITFYVESTGTVERTEVTWEPNYPEGRYSLVRDALITKYGKPAEEDEGRSCWGPTHNNRYPLCLAIVAGDVKVLYESPQAPVDRAGDL